MRVSVTVVFVYSPRSDTTVSDAFTVHSVYFLLIQGGRK